MGIVPEDRSQRMSEIFRRYGIPNDARQSANETPAASSSDAIRGKAAERLAPEALRVRKKVRRGTQEATD